MANDYGAYRATKVIKRYYNLKKYVLKHKGGTWFKTTLNPTFAGVIQSPCTYLNMWTGSGDGNDNVLTIDVEYFVKFRNPRR